MGVVESFLVSQLQRVPYVPSMEVLRLPSSASSTFRSVAIVIRGKFAATAEHVQMYVTLPELTEIVNLHINIPASAERIKLRFNVPASRTRFNITASAQPDGYLADVETVTVMGTAGCLDIQANIPISTRIGIPLLAESAEGRIEEFLAERYGIQMASRRVVDIPEDVQRVNIYAYPEPLNTTASSAYSSVTAATSCGNVTAFADGITIRPEHQRNFGSSSTSHFVTPRDNISTGHNHRYSSHSLKVTTHLEYFLSR